GLLKDAEAEVRLRAALAHWGIKQDADPVLPVLKELLRDRDAAVRAETAVALKYLARDLKERATRLADDLNAALKDEDYAVRVAAARALWAMREALKKEQYADVVPTLLDVLEEGDEPGRISAAQGLQNTPGLETVARVAYPLLTRMSQDDPSEDVQAAAREAA